MIVIKGSDTMKQWGEKRYYSLDYYIKEAFGEKLYKLSLNGGMTCPNRDGTLDSRGCIFCSAGGSGDFAGDRNLPIKEQLCQGKAYWDFLYCLFSGVYKYLRTTSLFRANIYGSNS